MIHIGTSKAGVVWNCYHNDQASINRMKAAFETQNTSETNKYDEYTEWTRMPATTQRSLFGFAVFGKKECRYNNDADVWLVHRKTSCDGGDYLSGHATTTELYAFASKKQTVPVC